MGRGVLAIHFLVCVLCAAFMVSCTYTKYKGGDPEISELSPEQKAKLSYWYVNEKVLKPRCIACHDGTKNSSLLSYQEVKGQIDKIQVKVFVERSMPKNQDPLTGEQASILHAWIKMGAPEHGAEPEPTPIPLEPTYNSISKNIFANKCVICHAPGKPGKRILLDLDSLLNSPYDLIDLEYPDESGLYVAVHREDDKRMPPKKEGYSRLSNEEIETILTWIQNGAKD